MQKAYTQYKDGLSDNDDNDIPTLDTWKATMISKHRQFQYWSLTLDIELAILNFVQSMRQRNFQLYIDTLVKLMPLFSALDHINYAQWLPVHIRDMLALQEMHPGQESLLNLPEAISY